MNIEDGNFKEFMTDPAEISKSIKLSEIFQKYCEFVAGNVSTGNLEVNTDDGTPEYEMVTATLEVDESKKEVWSNYTSCQLYLKCEEDEEMNTEINLMKWREKPYQISLDGKLDISSLRHLDSFFIFIMKLAQNNTSIEIDTYRETEEVRPEAEPEASFS